MRFILPYRRRRLLSTVMPTPPAGGDVVASTLGQIDAAYTAAPTNAARDYFIDVLPGTYGYLTIPPEYDKGTTRVVLRGAAGSRPNMLGIDARETNNLGFERLDLLGNLRDEFGFPNGVSGSTRGLRISDSTDIRLHNLRVENWLFGIEANNIQGLEVSYCTLRGNAVDSLRLYAIPDPNTVADVHVHHCVFDIHASAPNTFPDLSAMGLHYALPEACSIDPRRSDQYGYGNADSYVTNLAGSPVLVTSATKAGRHPDLIQGAGPWDNVVIEDCQLSTSNLYCHGIYTNNADDGGWAVSTGVIIRRNMITSAHPHAIAFMGDVAASTRVEQCVIRNFPQRTWAVNIPGYADNAGLMRPGISTREITTAATIDVVNTVVPSQTSSYWMIDANINASGMVRSNTAVPTGWETTDVALGRVGHAYAA